MCLWSCESDAQRGNRVPAELCFMVLVSQVFGESQTGFKAPKKGRVFSRKAWMNGQVIGDDYCAASLFAVCKGGGDALRGQLFCRECLDADNSNMEMQFYRDATKAYIESQEGPDAPVAKKTKA